MDKEIEKRAIKQVTSRNSGGGIKSPALIRAAEGLEGFSQAETVACAERPGSSEAHGLRVGSMGFMV